MSQTRRHFLVTTAATAGVVTLLPYAARAAAHAGDTFDTEAGPITVHPVSHASFVMETPKGTIYVDPVGDAAQYADFPPADLVLITHEHGDHYNAETLSSLVGESTQLITNPAVFDMLPDDLKGKATAVANAEMAQFAGMNIEAIPAYNMTEERKNFHPEGRDNGYVLNFDKFRVYISGDTEDIPEMRQLSDIDLAFVCMNLPFTMDVNAAASAVSEFAPTYVYPYHYRGRDGGTQDPEAFAKRVGTDVEVKMGKWYD
ncbi:MBL fold metallo-hydrolase [Sulfitobacter sp. G21635-S1]|uniref:MBL fold metallo-hydrolase n=1 Tax=Sulfitobacter sp. G21635-S1 TaxID=3014043 RepID=UPI0022AFAA9C|nr:MBL fold metallo-hydrolase [Sulfitobacter sp. G21635-S1]MCZ4258876.1 MBL fold metallo-hydrolase [Sulfitobacter sp. G21635-S1]